MVKSVLGRGVGALLPEESQDDADRFFMCDVDKISTNPNQPRSHFDEEKLQQLADSIQEKGIIQPLLVTRKASNRYVLIAGERRLRAARMLGHEEVPVVVMEEGDDRESLELALIENIQRHDLNPIEEALAYTRLMEEFNLTQEDVAKKVGRQRSTITNVLRLLQLPESVRNDVICGTISEGHARVLLRVKDDPDRLQDVRDRIIKDQLSVRATERICTQQPQSDAQPADKVKRPSPEELPKSYCAAVVNQLTNQLHTKVRIVQQGKRGRLEIEYYSSDDLDRLLSLLST
ncbi:ParB/RepB/Spo0J family partition protein [Desulfobulbus oligotrophicus]|jgi:ParB family chromosome partitioning protein|uniref:ParB/RepB/Spo0J family partition protein n=1 Tax=Desulfobulbus oligotrophicus TaxID=1909699 RepID=A0A7T5VBX6_9BACT|nr:ParB/RepB/Spo0J family partition protein [Desulfobulbus oligotrophicus]MDY0390784.1 ParB/RepB/Spo0J family partition protein [Desulfobulbus oligotrophicus]QQG65067.1 ParB/RepB/Spo0J family partition protein [Desulfobulbus oligotrophicus]